MTKNNKDTFAATGIICAAAVLLLLVLTGCTQVTRIKGIDAISPVGVEITCDFTLK